MMLSRILLRFEDYNMATRFKHEKKVYYKKALPIITVMVLLLAIALEIVYRIKL